MASGTSKVRTACENPTCPTFGVPVEVDPSVQQCIVCLDPLPRHGAFGPVDDHPPPRRSLVRWSKPLAVGLAAVAVVAIAGGLLAVGNALGKGGGSTPQTERFSVRDVANDDLSTTVISCDNGSDAGASVTVALFDGAGTAAGRRRATVAGNGTVSFATYPIPNLQPEIIDTTTFRGGSASIAASKDVDCTAILMSKAYPPTLQGELTVTPATSPRNG